MKAINIFYSYAQEDELLRQRLEKHLSTLKHQDLIAGWHHYSISAGSDWNQQVENNLNTAQIVLLLTSSDFLASEYCYGVEMKRALERHKNGQTRVIPIILRPVDREGTSFDTLRALPTDGRPVVGSQGRTVDEAFEDVAKGIRNVVKELNFTFSIPDLPIDSAQTLSPKSQNYSSLTTYEFLYRDLQGSPLSTDNNRIQLRSQLVESIVLKLSQPHVNALALTGLGGIGKSTVAAMINHSLVEQCSEKSHFYDPPLWLNIEPSTTFVDLIGTIFKVFNKSNYDLEIQSPTHQAHSLFSLLNTVPSRLIILDQFDHILDLDTGRVLDDRPGFGEWLNIINNQLLHSGCRLLMTSRSYPRGGQVYLPNYLQEHPVNGLTIDEGVAFLQKQEINAPNIELSKAVDLCGGHALSLVMLISLQKLYGIPLDDLLADTTLWNKEIADSLLNAIFNRLDDARQNILQGLAIYRLPVTIDAIKAIFNFYTSNELLIALKSLLIQNIVQTAKYGFFYLHTILRDYVYKRFTIRENKQSISLVEFHRRAAEYYAQLISQEMSKGEVLSVYSCVEGVWHYIQAHEYHQASNMLTKYQLLNILNVYGAYTVVFELCTQILSNHKWESEPEQKADIYLHLGHAHEVLGNTTQAIKCYEQSLELFRQETIVEEEIHALVYMGRVYCQHGDPQRGLQIHHQALLLCQGDEMEWAKAAIFNELGLVHRHLGDMEESLKWYYQALALDQGTKANRAGILNNLGEVYRNLGEIEKALECYRECLAELGWQGHPRLEATVLGNLSLIHKEQNEFLEALALYQQSFFISSKIGDRLCEGTALHNEAGIYLDQGQYHKALDLFQKVLTIRREIGDSSGEAFTLHQVSVIHSRQENYEDAIKCAWEAINLRRKIGDQFNEVHALESLGSFYAMSYRKEEAIYYYHQALIICRNIKYGQNEISLLLNIGRVFESEEKCIFALAAFLLAQSLIKYRRDQGPFDLNDLINTICEEFGEFRDIVYNQVKRQSNQILDYALDEYRKIYEKKKSAGKLDIPTIKLDVILDQSQNKIIMRTHTNIRKLANKNRNLFNV